jgi:hypothetical protein
MEFKFKCNNHIGYNMAPTDVTRRQCYISDLTPSSMVWNLSNVPQNVFERLPDHTASHSRKYHSSQPHPREIPMQYLILVRSLLCAVMNVINSVARLSAKLVPPSVDRGCHVVNVTHPYGRNLVFFRLELLLFIPSSSSVVLTRLSGPRSRPTTSQKTW